MGPRAKDGLLVHDLFDGEVVVYDFGCVKAVPSAVVASVRELLEVGALQDWAAVHRILGQLGGLADKASAARLAPLYRDIHLLTAVPLADPAGFDFARPEFIDALRANARSHLALSFSFKPVTDLVFVLRALSGHYWLMRALGARVNLAEVLAGHGLRLR